MKIKTKNDFLKAESSKLKAKKSLGQHFLNNKHYLNLVANAADIKKGETVVEIGPGEGALTQKLLAFGCRVLVLEKDRRLIPILQEKFKKEIASGQLVVIEGDALDFNPESYHLKATSYKVVGNIPYYITGALFKKFLSAARQPSALVFLLQKEVAERVTSRPSRRSGSPKESILSLSVKAYGTPTYIRRVPAGAFAPPPKVDSAILLVSGISRNNFKNKKHEERFFELVRAGFSQKRKQLGSTLKQTLGPDYAHKLERAGIAPTARAEDVPLAAWLTLAER